MQQSCILLSLTPSMTLHLILMATLLIVRVAPVYRVTLGAHDPPLTGYGDRHF
jgi:hypothetical protein